MANAVSGSGSAWIRTWFGSPNPDQHWVKCWIQNRSKIYISELSKILDPEQIRNIWCSIVFVQNGGVHQLHHENLHDLQGRGTHIQLETSSLHPSPCSTVSNRVFARKKIVFLSLQKINMWRKFRLRFSLHFLYVQVGRNMFFGLTRLSI